ncbi:MAG TPA: MauE/DoxX family redox-associated membrane protein [Thermomicrobiales bacterium]|nr:MauE/DoxX family redox-associated membrane protein [Thermomicrobiales bacterium]
MTIALLIALRLALAVVLAASAVSKLRGPSRFVRDVGRYRLLPGPVVVPAAGIVIIAEVVAAALLVVGHPAGPIVALVLTLVFAAAVGSALARGLAIPCGCFGGDETVSRRALVRVGLLGGTALLAVLLGPGVADRWVDGMDLVWVATAATGLLIAGRLVLLVPDVLAAMGQDARPAGEEA